jgi:hypothetical protein
MKLKTRIGATAAATALVVFGFGGQAHAQIVDPASPTTTATVDAATPQVEDPVVLATEAASSAPPALTEQGPPPAAPVCTPESGSLSVEVPPQSVDYKLTTIVHPTSDSIAVSIPAGRYTSVVGSFDDVHPYQDDQPNESWFAVFYGADGAMVATTTPTPDLLSTDVSQVWAGGPIVFTSDATSVVYTHAPGGIGPDSIYPNCLKLTPLVDPKQPEPKQPEPKQPNPNDPGPGGNDPEQPPEQPKPEPERALPDPSFVIPVIQVLPDPVVLTTPPSTVVGPPAPVAAAAPPTPEAAAVPAPSAPEITPTILGVDVVPDTVPAPIPTPDSPAPEPTPPPAPATVPEIARTGTEPRRLLLTSMDLVGFGTLLVWTSRRNRSSGSQPPASQRMTIRH